MLRVAKTAAETLTHMFYVGETPTDSTSTVTVVVKDATGVTVASGNAAHGVTGQYTFALPGQALLSLLAVAWSATIAGAAVVETDVVEVVGGFLFTLAEGRASDPTLSSGSTYPTSALVAKRQRVEEEVEWICDRAFTPHYRRVVLDGTGDRELILPDGDIRTIRSASVSPAPGQAAVALTSMQLAALAVEADSTLVRTDGNVWTDGRGNVVVEYEYGLDAPPAGLKDASLQHFRHRLRKPRDTFGDLVGDRATSFAAVEGGTFKLSMPDIYRTGIPEVDAVYSRYSRRTRGDEPAVASRTLTYDVQRNSMFHSFHGGRW